MRCGPPARPAHRARFRQAPTSTRRARRTERPPTRSATRATWATSPPPLTVRVRDRGSAACAAPRSVWLSRANLLPRAAFVAGTAEFTLSDAQARRARVAAASAAPLTARFWVRRSRCLAPTPSSAALWSCTSCRTTWARATTRSRARRARRARPLATLVRPGAPFSCCCGADALRAGARLACGVIGMKSAA